MNVKLEDFEIYRERLKKYALGLIRCLKFKREFSIEDEMNAEDIVQNTYLIFHKKEKNTVFENEFHLFSYLKLCLYNCYKQFISNKDYAMFEWLSHNNFDIIKNRGEEIVIEETDKTIEEIDLTNLQLNIVNRKLQGINNKTIALELNVSESSVSSALKLAQNKILGTNKKIGGGEQETKAVIKCSILGEPIMEYNSIKEAANDNGLHSSAICRCLKGGSFSSGKFRWKYKNEEKK